MATVGSSPAFFPEEHQKVETAAPDYASGCNHEQNVVKKEATVITFGTFDLFHLGHLLILERAAAFGTRLIVGVSSDALTLKKKGKKPIFDEQARVQLVKSLQCVSEVFIEHSLEDKRQYCVEHGAEIFIMGDDHLGRFDKMLENVCECHYLPRTKGVSSTDIEIILQERLNTQGVLDKAQKELLEKSLYDSMIAEPPLPVTDSTVAAVGEAIGKELKMPIGKNSGSTTCLTRGNASTTTSTGGVHESPDLPNDSSQDDLSRRASDSDDHADSDTPVSITDMKQNTELTEENLKSWTKYRMRQPRTVKNLFDPEQSESTKNNAGNKKNAATAATPTSPSATTLLQETSSSSAAKLPDTSTASAAHESCNVTCTKLTHAERNVDDVSCKWLEKVMYVLVWLHDVYYLWIQKLCSPLCKAIPREVEVPAEFVPGFVATALAPLDNHQDKEENKKSTSGVVLSKNKCKKDHDMMMTEKCSPTVTLTVFTANIVTYARTLLTLVICGLLKYEYGLTAAFLVMYHDFLDHVDGVVAKVQREDGRAKNDDGRWGGFVDAQCDKVVFCTCLWTLIILNQGVSGDAGALTYILNCGLLLTCFLLICMELAIAWVRTRDYFQAVYNTSASAKQGALRAISEGKLKQKMESCGVAVLCLISPYPMAQPALCITGMALLWVGTFFAFKSLEHKLRHSVQ
ncbi:unnamed protein product [Amoebophrya sp. A120]|nr:unnamed protein product [Amoebophrya sp. A120]|eukprot:GSA120T00016840001.1